MSPLAPRSPRDELADVTSHGSVYLERLMRAQLGLALLALTAFGGLIGSLPLIFLLAPGLQDAELIGMPVTLLVLAVPPFPLILALGLIYQRRADAIDEAFREVVSERDSRAAP